MAPGGANITLFRGWPGLLRRHGQGRAAVRVVLDARSALAASYSPARRATNSAAVGTCFTAPMPWPQPQMSRQALASWLPPEPKFIFEGSLCGRFSGSSPALITEGRR